MSITNDCGVDAFSKWAYTKLADASARCKHNKAQRCLPMFSADECRECYCSALPKGDDE